MVNDDRPEEKHSDSTRQKEEVTHERFELLYHVSAFLEPAMVVLGLVFLVLLLMEFASVPLTILGENRLGDVLQLIWVIFLVDFLLRFVIAPSKGAYLRDNWLGALSLALPFLRPLRFLRVARAVRGMSLVRLLGGFNRAMRVLRRIMRGRQFAFVGMLTLIVALGGAVGVRYFDRGYPDSPIQTFGDALWWSSTLVTTMNSELYVVSTEARAIAFLQRLYALSIFGYITASIASYLIGSDVSSREDREHNAALMRELGQVRRELSDIRAEIRAATNDISGSEIDHDGDR